MDKFKLCSDSYISRSGIVSYVHCQVTAEFYYYKLSIPDLALIIKNNKRPYLDHYFETGQIFIRDNQDVPDMLISCAKTRIQKEMLCELIIYDSFARYKTNRNLIKPDESTINIAKAAKRAGNRCNLMLMLYLIQKNKDIYELYPHSFLRVTP
jgi:hypothetical protein